MRDHKGKLLLVAAGLGIMVCGCGGSGVAQSSSTRSPTVALRSAIDTLENEPRYSFTLTYQSPFPTEPPVLRNEVDIQQPDSISVTGGLNVIAIGSTGYFKSQAGWMTVHHSGEATNFANDMLEYVNLLKRATSVTRHGDSYTVPEAEAITLLKMTGLNGFAGVTTASYSAEVSGGVIESVLLHTQGGSPTTVKMVVTNIDSSPPVTAPNVG